MSTAVMQQPPTPPSNELQYGLHHVARHNAGSPPHEEWRKENDYAQAVQSQSSYGSPGLAQQSSDPFMNEPYGDDRYQQDQNTAEVGLGVQYPGYPRQSEYFVQDPNGYSGSAYVGALNDAPMTPRSDTSLGPRTRSGRSAARSDSPSVLGSQTNLRVSKTRARKSRSNKAVNSKTPKLDAPLSELTKDMSIPVRDMVAWVNRSDEERQLETEKRNGYITRPMNSFMLYRSAYAERTKQWCLQNNHQVVSSVSGESWPMEPDEVRDHYNKLAKMERENHARAHPSYKFSPSKTPTASKKKKNGYVSDEDEDEGATDSGDPDWEWRPRNDRSVRPKIKRQGREAGFPANSNLNTMFETPAYGFEAGMNAYAWGNQTRGTPYDMSQLDQYSQFYHVQPGLGPTSHPFMTGSFDEGMPAAIPGLNAEEMFQPEQPINGGMGHQVDPMLLSIHDSFEHGSNDGQQVKMEQEPIPNEFADAEGLFGQDMEHWTNSAQV